MLNELLKKYEIVLASASPRRKHLLKEMEISFRVAPKDIIEDFPVGISPQFTAEFLSKKKSDAFSEKEISKSMLIITADTIVALDNEIIGKPIDRDEAVAMLKKLSGKTHIVITGITLRTTRNSKTFSSLTKVSFKKMDLQEIIYYVDKFKPFDKAGAYGIQEWIGLTAIEKVEGSYFNVMGLPTVLLYKELLTFIAKDGL